MRVRSKNHAVALRDKGARFYNQFGDPSRIPAQEAVHAEYYRTALQHLFNTITSFDYLYQGQVGTLEKKVDILARENQRLASETRRLQQEVEAMRAALRAREAASRRPPAREARRNGASRAVDARPGPSAALLRYLLQGLRNFMDHHNDAGVTGALSFLIQHALTQLQAAPQAPCPAAVQQAMYANLYTLSQKLCTYRGHPLHGFQAAVEELEACQPGLETLAEAVPAQTSKRSEAKIFQETLKLLRDQARLDFRPYFYEIDPEDGTVFSIG